MELYEKYSALLVCKNDIDKALHLIIDTYNKGGKLLLCGNGGSDADCDHIVGELMKGFLKKRANYEKLKTKLQSVVPEEAEYMATRLQGALPAISLSSRCMC